jgi:hypothetical protein
MIKDHMQIQLLLAITEFKYFRLVIGKHSGPYFEPAAQ